MTRMFVVLWCCFGCFACQGEKPAAQANPALSAGQNVDEGPDKADAKGPVETKTETTKSYHWNVDKAGLAMRGYDPVSYQKGDAPERGKAQFHHEWDGVNWRFASAENLESFRKSPKAFAPALGGYCTFGIVIDKKLDGDPTVYWLDDRGLYLFLNEEVRGKFLKDTEGNRDIIATNWQKIKNVNPTL